MFGGAVLKPVLPPPGILDFWFNSFGSEPIRIFPPSIYTKVGPRICQPVVERRFARIAGGFVLLIGISIFEHKAKHFNRAILEIFWRNLERHHASDVDFGDIDIWHAIHNPLGHDFSSPATHENTQ